MLNAEDGTQLVYTVIVTIHTNMTDEQLIIAVAKLDNWVREESEHPIFKSRIIWWIKHTGTFERRIPLIELPPYLTSRDAIIPVIEKVVKPTKQITSTRFSDILMNELEGYTDTIYGDFEIKQMLFATPKQFSIALVKATGNWTEE